MPSVLTYFGIMTGIFLVLYFMGYQSPFLYLVNSVGSDAPYTDIANALINALLNPAILIPALAGSIITAGVVGGRDFYWYLIPTLSVFILFNIFILPTSFIFSAGFPGEVALAINTVLNAFLVLGVVGFVRYG